MTGSIVPLPIEKGLAQARRQQKAHATWGEAREGRVVRQVKYSEWTPTGLPS